MDKLETKHGLVNICSHKKELASASANCFVQICKQAIGDRGLATVGLSGGSTPPVLYEELIAKHKKDLDWSKVHFFISDERCVPVEDKDSNWGMAQKLLFSQLPIPEENLHPPKDQAADPAASAEEYEQTLREFFKLEEGQLPRFDLLQLGMGPDGHTASLFPNTKAIGVTDRLVVANFVDKFETYRITFTFPVINNAAHVMFMLQGEEKSHVFAEAVQTESISYPVQRVQPTDGQVTWFVDEPSARDLLARVRK